MWKDAYWIGVPDTEIRQKNIYQGDMNGRFALFRLTFDLVRPGSLTLDISAYSRYRLWANGEPVCSGPCRSSAFRYYFETVAVGAHLRAGTNVLAVQVLLCDSSYTTDWNTDADKRIGQANHGGERCRHHSAESKGHADV